MKSRLFSLILTFLIISSLLFSFGKQTASGQSPLPQNTLEPSAFQRQPSEPPVPGAIYNQKQHLWMVSGKSVEPSKVSLSSKSFGIPDDFGYSASLSSFNDTDWKDTVSGTNAGLTSHIDSVYDIPLPFSFKYFENTYSRVNIFLHGYIQFGSPSTTLLGQENIISPFAPNNIIVGYWNNWRLAEGNPYEKVVYATGGSAPNRYFVIDWSVEDDLSNKFWFQIVLHENGDFDLLYSSMSYGQSGVRYCGFSSFEDIYGTQGQTIIRLCDIIEQKIVRVTRPAPSARIKIPVMEFGALASAGAETSFTVRVVNAGDLGVDVFNIPPLGSIYRTNGAQLTDTNGDGLVDTGQLQPGQALDLVYKVKMENIVNPGELSEDDLIFTSALHNEVSIQRAITIKLMTPDPFAEIRTDYIAGKGYELNLQIHQPLGTATYHVSSGLPGVSPDLIELPKHNYATAWNQFMAYPQPDGQTLYGENVSLAILRSDGQWIKSPILLTDDSPSGLVFHDSPVVANTPDGHIAVAWIAQKQNEKGEYNDNVFLAILDSQGNLIWGPANLTNDSSMHSYSDLNGQHRENLMLTGAGSNNFFLAWKNWHYGILPPGQYIEVDDLFTAVVSTAGKMIQPLTNRTNNTGLDAYDYPFLFHLAGNRVVLFANLSNVYGNVVEALEFDASGSFINRYDVSLHCGSVGKRCIRSTAVQKPNGQIVIATEERPTYGGSYFSHQLVLYDSNFNSIHRPAYFGMIPEVLYENLINGNEGRVAMVQKDELDVSRYYLLTYLDMPQNQMAPLRSDWHPSTSPGKASVAPYTIPPVQGVDVFVNGDTVVGARPGYEASIPITVGNLGTQTASGLLLKAALDPDLEVIPSYGEPVCQDHVCTWTISDLKSQGAGKIISTVKLPLDSPIGKVYSVQFTLSSTETDANNANNSITVNFVSSLQTFIPIISR